MTCYFYNREAFFYNRMTCLFHSVEPSRSSSVGFSIETNRHYNQLQSQLFQIFDYSFIVFVTQQKLKKKE